jgi:hypothetical protein
MAMKAYGRVDSERRSGVWKTAGMSGRARRSFV